MDRPIEVFDESELHGIDRIIQRYESLFVPEFHNLGPNMKKILTKSEDGFKEARLYMESPIFEYHNHENETRATLASFLIVLQRAVPFIEFLPEFNDINFEKIFFDHYRYYKAILMNESSPTFSIIELAKENARGVFIGSITGQNELKAAIGYIDEWNEFQWSKYSFPIEHDSVRLSKSRILKEDETHILMLINEKSNLKEICKAIKNDSNNYFCVICQRDVRVDEDESVSCRICLKRIGHFHCVRELLDNELCLCPMYARCRWFSTKEKVIANTRIIERTITNIF